MSLGAFLQSLKPNQSIYLLVPGALIRGSFAKCDSNMEFLQLNQAAIFQNSQATGSVSLFTVELSNIIAWG